MATCVLCDAAAECKKCETCLRQVCVTCTPRCDTCGDSRCTACVSEKRTCGCCVCALCEAFLRKNESHVIKGVVMCLDCSAAKRKVTVTEEEMAVAREVSRFYAQKNLNITEVFKDVVHTDAGWTHLTAAVCPPENE